MSQSKNEDESTPPVSPVGNVAAALIGGGAFVLFLLVLKIGIIVSLAVGALGYGAGLLIFSSKKPDKMMIEAHLHGVSEEMLKKTLEEGYWKLGQIRAFAGRIQDKRISRKVEAIGNAVEEIFENFKKDPKDIKAARSFLNYQLDAAIKVITKYYELSNRRVQSADITGSLNKTESLLESIEKAFKNQLAKLLEDDVMELDTEVELLKKTLKMEGLEDN
ncbi:MAG: hypothetical protein QG657_4930 [Acidobacteriota bacterium]|nr:hypothetical protein [Acidobacteriota bacterium]